VVPIRPSASLHSIQDYSTIKSLHSFAIRVGVPQVDDMAEEDVERALGFVHIRPVLVVMRGLYNQKMNGISRNNQASKYKASP